MQIQIWLFGGGLNTGTMVPSHRLHGRRLNTGTMMAVSPAFALKSQNSVSFCMSPSPPNCSPSTGAQSECLKVSEYVCRLLKRTPVFPAAFNLTRMVGIPDDFCSHMLWGLLFLAFLLQDWEPGVGPRPLTLQARLPQLRFLLILNHHTWVWQQPISHLCPSYQSQGIFFISLDIRLLFS